ncbi:hypothetical protein HNY73_015257 [Argiope bruennichi]|uniref:Uncharacterized protein n=1 Tax=Argiope bruennichi TaxID=94029 RepID=A0A8T0EVX9_ARGBR|nr:hypothetical protein HNY73_015257 [Argiope bruennichi]
MDKSTLLKLGLGATVAVAAPPTALYFLGFTSAGVAAGSVAAVVQSKIGLVTAGSAFAACQSMGAAGLAAGTKVGLGCIGAIAAKKIF